MPLGQTLDALFCLMSTGSTAQTSQHPKLRRDKRQDDYKLRAWPTGVPVLRQEAVDDFSKGLTAGALVDDRSMTQWLESSFRALRSDDHRQMFLDAATLLHGELQLHLCAAWAAHMQLDPRREDMDRDQAGRAVSRLLKNLLDSSLVTIAHGTADEGDPVRDGIEHTAGDQQDDRCALLAVSVSAQLEAAGSRQGFRMVAATLMLCSWH